MIRNFNEEEIHSIQALCNHHHFDVFVKYLDEHLGLAKNSLIDDNDDVMRGHAYCLRALIAKIEEAKNFKPTESFGPVTNVNHLPGADSFSFP